MAEIPVRQVLARLAVFLADEVELAKELRESISSLQDSLQWIQSFLKDADHQRREQKSDWVRVWVNQIRDVAYDVEDVLDGYLLKVEQQRQKLEQHQQWHVRCMDFFWSLINFVTQICTRHDLVQRIKQINTRLDKIKANKEMFSLDNTASSSSSSIGPDILGRNELEDDVLEDGVVGFDEHAKTLIERLTDPKVPQRTVISIAGMAGLGKTTLAAKVYNDEKIKSHFGCQAWVSVSQEYEIGDIIRKLLRQVTGHDGDVKMLREYLKNKRYLVVIDDIWDIAAWDGIKAALPKGDMGSRVLLTTRQAHVAQHADPDTPPHDLNLLGPEASWDLFTRKAFQSAHCPADLEPLKDTILAKCDGLPLAIVVLGGILRRKHASIHAWSKVLEQLPVELRREDQTLKILALSYDVLPHHLKSCFLYFAAFPEDSEINAQTLTRLWIAEGFMQPEHGQTMEELAEESLKELIQRSMVIPKLAEKNMYIIHGGIRIHDLFLELARSEAKEVNFLLTQGNSRDVLPPPTVRRFSLSADCTEHDFQTWSAPKLRTLRCFSINNQLLSSSFPESKLLRVIDLQSVQGLEFLPEEIGGMALLRYLGLMGSSIKKLPSSIGNLRNLQTLDVSCTEISEITSTFWKIRTLRHVLVDAGNFRSNPEIPYCLNGLDTLDGVPSGSWVRNDGLMNVPNLRILRLHGILPSEERSLLKSLEKLKFLTAISLQGDSLPAEVLISSKHHHLQTLILHGEMNMCKLDPTLTSKQILPSLNTLVLERSRLKKDTITLIAALPNLHWLVLSHDAYIETVLMCPSDGFPRLTVLDLQDLDDLEELEVKDEALPCLKELDITSCKAMRMLPAGLQHIRTLQWLRLFYMPTISTRIEKEIGEDYPKIQHVPHVLVIN